MKLFTNQRERILAAALIGVVAIALHVVLADSMSRRGKVLKDEKRKLELALLEADTLLEEKEEWLAKRSWIYFRQPSFVSDEEAEKEMLRLADSATTRSLEITGRELLEMTRKADTVEAGLRLQLSGEMEDLLTWLHQIQNPREFREVREFSLTPQGPGSSAVNCSLTMIRHYRRPS